MHHRRLVLVDLYPAFEEFFVVGAAGIPGCLHVSLAAHGEHSHVDTPMSCRQQQVEKTLARHEVRIADVERLPRARNGERQISFRGCASGARNTVHQTSLHIAYVGKGALRKEHIPGEQLTGRFRPCSSERCLEGADCRALESNVCLPPLVLVMAIAKPVVSESKTSGITDRPIHDYDANV